MYKRFDWEIMVISDVLFSRGSGSITLVWDRIGPGFDCNYLEMGLVWKSICMI